MILSASINRDLKSDKKQILLSVLNSLPKLITGDTLVNFVDNVKTLTQNQDSLIQSKSIVCIHKFIQLDRSVWGNLDQIIQNAISSKYPWLVISGLNMLYQESIRTPQDYVKFITFLI